MILLLALALFAVAVYLFIHFIVRRDRGRREPIGALFAAIGFGIVAVIGAAVLNGLLVPKELVDSIGRGPVSMSALQILTSTLTIGIIEESLKCIPLAIFLYKKRYFDELTDGVIYFGITALTFGILEDILYSIGYGGGTGVVRILMAPYLHAGFTVLFGVTLAYRKVLGRSWWLVVGGYSAAVLAHALYNFFALSGGIVGSVAVLATTLSLNVLLFVLFRKTQMVDEDRGQSAIGINKFCRDCGKANPKQLLYCSYCGKKA